MTNSIRELTEKIYTEGVVKANTEAEKIISDAKKVAEEIIRSANQEKEIIFRQATAEAEDVKRKVNSEIKLATLKMISNLKQNIADLVVTKQVDSFGSSAFNDEKFVKELILLVIQNWTKKGMKESGLNMLVPQNEEKKIAAYFENKLIEQLNNGIDIKVDPNIKNGFKIGPKDGNYIVSFTGEDFENYFKSYLKEKTWKLIFDTK